MVKGCHHNDVCLMQVCGAAGLREERHTRPADRQVQVTRRTQHKFQNSTAVPTIIVTNQSLSPSPWSQAGCAGRAGGVIEGKHQCPAHNHLPLPQGQNIDLPSSRISSLSIFTFLKTALRPRLRTSDPPARHAKHKVSKTSAFS